MRGAAPLNIQFALSNASTISNFDDTVYNVSFVFVGKLGEQHPQQFFSLAPDSINNERSLSSGKRSTDMKDLHRPINNEQHESKPKRPQSTSKIWNGMMEWNDGME